MKNSNTLSSNHKKAFSRSIYDTLLQAYRPYLFKILLVTIFGFCGRVLMLSNAQLIAKVYDKNPTLSEEVLSQLVGELFFILLISLTMTILYRTIFSRLSAQAVSRIYDETTYRVSRYPLSFFDHNPVGKITTRFSSDYGNVFRLFGGPLAEFLSILFDLIAIVLLITMTHPLFLVNIILAGGSFYYILKRNQLRLRDNRRELSILRGPSVAHFSETVQGSLSIRQSQKENTFINRFQKLDQLFIQSKKLIAKNIFRFSSELNIMSTLLFILNGFLGLYLINRHSIGAGQLAVILGFTVLATNTLQMFFEWYSQFEEALVGVERLDEYLRMPLEEGAFLPAQSDFETTHPRKRPDEEQNHQKNDTARQAIESTDHLIVENLSFRYPQTDQDVLSGISFKLNRGEKLGIIGRTGAGKSTIIAALQRMYPIKEGVILINRQYKQDIEDHRQQFSVITQDQFFIRGTLRDNLDLFKNFSNDRLQNVLKTVGLQLPLQSPVEEKGQNLSQGEKQLISLARGLLLNAEIFIFDEATANVDPQSEQLIEKALKETLSEKTQIRIAHRLQTVEDCDKIIWIDHGKIKKSGSPKEVLVEFEAAR